MILREDTSQIEAPLKLKAQKVGSLLCQKNASLSELEAKIVSVVISNNNTTKLILTDTILFPTGGGQPFDKGSINGYQVIDCFRQGMDCIHVISGVLDPDSLKPGMTVLIKLDTGRRFDHMQQHSGQHLLSALGESEFGLDTVGWGLGESECYIEVVCEGREVPTMDELQALEKRVNLVIRERRPFSVHVDEDKEASKKVSSLPGDINEGVVRYIEIEGVDKNP
jgi:misacylated tRNA(Ala) deacylase